LLGSNRAKTYLQGRLDPVSRFLPYEKIDSGHPKKFEKIQSGPELLPDDPVDHKGSFTLMANVHNGSEASGKKPTRRIFFTL
jgi:hypothetical protein